MNYTLKQLGNIIMLAFVLACASIVIFGGAIPKASAYEVATGQFLACDTQAQAERLASFLNYDEKSALQVVNIEAEDSGACGPVNVAYVRGKVLGTVRNGTEVYEVVEVLVLAADMGNDKLQYIEPALNVALIKVDDRPA
jgi:hypothetical protein